jgi:hypothetical protein
MGEGGGKRVWISPGGDQAVLYQLQWTNPRPDAEIASVDLVYGPDGSRWGTPALLAITAATAGR